MANKYWIGEKASFDITLTSTNVSTSGLTVYAYLVDVDGTATSVGSTSGAASGTDLTITCSLGSLVPGVYHFEVVANPDGAAPVTLIPNTTTSRRVLLRVGEVYAIS